MTLLIEFVALVALYKLSYVYILFIVSILYLFESFVCVCYLSPFIKVLRRKKSKNYCLFGFKGLMTF